MPYYKFYTRDIEINESLVSYPFCTSIRAARQRQIASVQAFTEGRNFINACRAAADALRTDTHAIASYDYIFGSQPDTKRYSPRG